MTSNLYYYFLKDCILGLEEKYQDLIKEHEDLFYLAANYLEIPSYYNLTSLYKNRDYDLNNKFNDKEKTAQLIDFLANEIYKNNYNTEYLLILYGVICHFILKKVLKTYINGLFTNFSLNKFTKKQQRYREELLIKCIESEVYKERENKAFKKYDSHKEHLIYLTDDLNTLTSDIFSKVYYFTYGKEMYLKSLKKYKTLSWWHKDSFGFKKVLLEIYDFLTFFKERNTKILSNHINLKRDYLNKNNKIWYTKEDGKELSLAYNELIAILETKTIKVLNKITEIIFYQKHYKGSLIKLLEKENLI